MRIHHPVVLPSPLSFAYHKSTEKALTSLPLSLLDLALRITRILLVPHFGPTSSVQANLPRTTHPRYFQTPVNPATNLQESRVRKKTRLSRPSSSSNFKVSPSSLTPYLYHMPLPHLNRGIIFASSVGSYWLTPYFRSDPTMLEFGMLEFHLDRAPSLHLGPVTPRALRWWLW